MSDLEKIIQMIETNQPTVNDIYMYVKNLQQKQNNVVGLKNFMVTYKKECVGKLIYWFTDAKNLDDARKKFFVNHDINFDEIVTIKEHNFESLFTVKKKYAQKLM